MSSHNSTPSKSEPIPIHGRHRSASESSVESEPAGTPAAATTPPRVKIATSATSPSTSPILSYFFPGSPTKAPFKVAPNQYAPVLEDDEMDMPPASAHARRMSTSWTVPRSAGQPAPTAPAAAAGVEDRGTGLLRRLSLGSAFAKPSPPVAPPAPPAERRVRRSTTLAVPNAGAGARPPRAPSPMGERILKGHFDGFV